jgi:DNA-binding response OmpR family regulator
MNTILVVEDEPMTADMLDRFFEVAGYEVQTAMTGWQAIDMALELQPRVIILDIMLPDTDGYEVCRDLRSRRETQHIPIIFLTQKDERSDRLDGLELGADDYITKPFDIEELLLRVRNIVNRTDTTPLLDPRTGLPNIDLIKERLPELVEDPDTAFLNVQIRYFAPYRHVYGDAAAVRVMQATATLLADLLSEIEPADMTFIGHPQDDHFLLAYPRQVGSYVEHQVIDRFMALAPDFYDYPDQIRGGIQVGGRVTPFMQPYLLRIANAALRRVVVRWRQAVDPAAPAETAAAEESDAEDGASPPQYDGPRRLPGRRSHERPALPPPQHDPNDQVRGWSWPPTGLS